MNIREAAASLIAATDQDAARVRELLQIARNPVCPADLRNKILDNVEDNYMRLLDLINTAGQNNAKWAADLEYLSNLLDGFAE